MSVDGLVMADRAPDVVRDRFMELYQRLYSDIVVLGMRLDNHDFSAAIRNIMSDATQFQTLIEIVRTEEIRNFVLEKNESQYLYAVALAGLLHDISSGVQKIIHATELLDDPAANVTGIKKSLYSIIKNGRLRIDECLTYGEMGPFSIESHLLDLKKKYQALLRDEGIDLTVECQEINTQVVGRQSRLQRFLINSILNAHKARYLGSEKSQVAVRGYMDHGYPVIEIEDEGVGINHYKIAGGLLLKGVRIPTSLYERVRMIYQPGVSLFKLTPEREGHGDGLNTIFALEQEGWKVDLETHILSESNVVTISKNFPLGIPNYERTPSKSTGTTIRLTYIRLT